LADEVVTYTHPLRHPPLLAAVVPLVFSILLLYLQELVEKFVYIL
jgi:hypothetical protein